VDSKLLELLVCPVTKGELKWMREEEELWSKAGKLAFPIEDGIPVLLAEKARGLTDEELANA